MQVFQLTCVDCGVVEDKQRKPRGCKDGKMRCKKCSHLFRSRKYLASAKGKIYQKKYAKDNSAKKVELAKKWAEDNHERRLEIQKKYRQSDKGKAKEYARNKRRYWRDLEYNRLKARARINGSTVPVISEILEEQTECQICGAIDKLRLDHMIPVAKGGKGTKDNLQVLCDSCNVFKGDKIFLAGNQGFIVDVRATA